MTTTAAPETARRAPAGTQAADRRGADPVAPSTSGLQVGAADDAYERAADAVADQVLRRLSESGELGHEHGAGCGHGSAPAAMGAEGGAVEADTAARIKASNGAPLPTAVRRSMEGAFGGADFGGVKLHTGAGAASLSATLGAQAFTVGKDVFLGAGVSDLQSSAGQRVLAHELAHTQQESTTVHRWDFFKKKPAAPAVPGATVQSGAAAVELLGTTDKAPEAADGDLETAIAGGEVLGEGAGISDVVGEVNDFNSGMNDVDGVKAGEAGHRAQLGSDGAGNALSHAGTATAGFGLLLAGATAVNLFGDTEASPEKRWDAGFGVADGVTGTANSIGGSVKAAEGGESASHATKETSKILGEIAGIVGTVKLGYETVKKIIAAIDSGSGETAGDLSAKVIDVVGGLIETAKGVMETLNAFLSHLGGITGPLLAAVPALGIALSAIEIIGAGVAIGIAAYEWRKMRSDKRTAKDALLSIVKGRKVTAESTGWGGHASAVAEANEILGIVDYEARLTNTVAGRPSGDAAAKAAAEKYLMLRELQLKSAKSIRRGSLNIGAALPSLAGDIAVLSGVGAGVGVGLKATGSGIKLGASIVRSVKQRWHDWRGDDKSTTKKRERYDRTIMTLCSQVKQIGNLPTPAGTPVQIAQIEKEQAATRTQVMSWVYASGISDRHLKAFSGDGKGLYRTWMEAMTIRDGKG